MTTINFYLYDKHASAKTYIIMHFRYDGKKLIYSTRQKVLPQDWDGKAKQATGKDADEINQILSKLSNQVGEIYLDLKNKGRKPQNKALKSRLDEFIHSHIKINSRQALTSISPKSQSFFDYFNQFISESENRIRLQKNGNAIRKSTVRNYKMVRDHLLKFVQVKEFPLEIKIITGMTHQEYLQTRQYWDRFYIEFTNYLYYDCDNFDNAVGAKIRCIRAFFNYLKEKKCLDIGDYHKDFAVYNENIQVIALEPEQVQYLITNKKLDLALSQKLQRVRDIFVFGCTVALRVSDLLSLTVRELGRERRQAISESTIQENQKGHHDQTPLLCC